jgi:hypothetical protein
MAPRPSKEEQKIIAVIEKMPFTAKDKKAWVKTIQDYGLNEELVKEILGKISKLRKVEDALAIARQGAELNRLIQSWRLSTNLSGGRHKF